MSIADLMNTYSDAHRKLWGAFGTAPLGYPIRDLRDKPWMKTHHEVFVAEIIDETRDEVYENAEYGGEIIGTSEWQADGYRMVAVYNNGTREAWLLTTECEVKE